MLFVQIHRGAETQRVVTQLISDTIILAVEYGKWRLGHYNSVVVLNILSALTVKDS